MASIQPIGSVLDIGGRHFVVVGHRMTRDGVAAGAGYMVVPYPLGFVDADSLAVVPASAVDGIVSVGFADEATEAYLEEFEGLAQASAGIPYDEYAESERLLRDFAAQEVRHG